MWIALFPDYSAKLLLKCRGRGEGKEWKRGKEGERRGEGEKI